MATTTTAPKTAAAKAQLPWDRIAAGVPAATMTLLLGIISLGSAAFFHLDTKIDANTKDLSGQIDGVRQDISDLKTLIIQSMAGSQ